MAAPPALDPWSGNFSHPMAALLLHPLPNRQWSGPWSSQVVSSTRKDVLSTIQPLITADNEYWLQSVGNRNGTRELNSTSTELQQSRIPPAKTLEGQFLLKNESSLDFHWNLFCCKYLSIWELQQFPLPSNCQLLLLFLPRRQVFLESLIKHLARFKGKMLMSCKVIK